MTYAYRLKDLVTYKHTLQAEASQPLSLDLPEFFVSVHRRLLPGWAVLEGTEKQPHAG